MFGSPCTWGRISLAHCDKWDMPSRAKAAFLYACPPTQAQTIPTSATTARCSWEPLSEPLLLKQDEVLLANLLQHSRSPWDLPTGPRRTQRGAACSELHWMELQTKTLRSPIGKAPTVKGHNGLYARPPLHFAALPLQRDTLEFLQHLLA